MALIARISPPADHPVLESMTGRVAQVAGAPVLRLLPARERRTIGPWCFVDHAGPFSGSFDVGEHPHIGLQTVTWLIEGEVVHRDSLGNEQVIRPGQLNLMTAGRGIAHAERGLPGRSHVVQMWVALPEGAREGEAFFDHYSELPRREGVGWTATLLVGEAFGLRSPARVFSPIVGLELQFTDDAPAIVPLNPSFEHGVFVVDGRARVEELELERDVLVYLGTQREQVSLQAPAGTRVLLLGGAHFGEPILMWWNFVARSEPEIRAARAAWRERTFDSIPNYDGEWVDAPELR